MVLRFSEEEYQEFLSRGAGGKLTPFGDPNKNKKKNKYRNEKCEIDGKKFDSRHEAEVYRQLELLRAAGEIKVIMRQAPFDLPGNIVYKADFCTIDAEGVFHVIDAKSPITKQNRLYINKKKQMKAIWGIDIEEI